MKQTLLFLLSFVLCSAYGQEFYIEQDQTFYDAPVYHNDSLCPLVYSHFAKVRPVTQEQVAHHVISKCKYCFKDKKLTSCEKTYVPRYNTNFYTVDLLSGVKDSAQSCNITHRDTIFHDKIVVEVNHEGVDAQKIEAIKNAHFAENAAMIATGLSAVGSISALSRGKWMNAMSLAALTSANATITQVTHSFAKTVESLNIVVSFTNISEHELVLNDETQGRVFHLLPNGSVIFTTYDMFDIKFRLEDEFATSREITYVYFGTTNNLIKVRPELIDRHSIYIYCPPFDVVKSHYIEADEMKKSSFPYSVSREDYSFKRISVEELEGLKK